MGLWTIGIFMKTTRKFIRVIDDFRTRWGFSAATSNPAARPRGVMGVLRMGDVIMSSLPALETVILPAVLLFILLMA